eukprot:jgi/Tetstr1/457429/TSEL_004213.t1
MRVLRPTDGLGVLLRRHPGFVRPQVPMHGDPSAGSPLPDHGHGVPDVTLAGEQRRAGARWEKRRRAAPYGAAGLARPVCAIRRPINNLAAEHHRFGGFTCTSAVLNGHLEARGFWGPGDERQYITWTELNAVQLAVESFMPHLAGRRVLLHEDNHAVYKLLAGLTSRFPEMTAEQRWLWNLLDSNGIHVIRSAANVWVDRLSRHLDSDDYLAVGPRALRGV